MADAASIERDPQWLPHALDMGQRRMQFLRIPRAELSSPAFLADRKPASAEDVAWLPFEAVLAMRPAPGRLHFIFHTAFCRSTLLVRALDIEGVSAGLSEPGIIAALAGAGDAAQPLVRPVLDLLGRPFGESAGGRCEAVFVKPTNHSNRLIPALLAARPDARAVLMTNPLPSFLRSVAGRGLLGRRWGRQLYLEMMAYAGMDLGMDAREQFSMTDLQAAGLAWFLAQRYFTALRAGGDGARLAVLDGDRFAAERARTLAAVARFAGVDLAREQAEAVAGGPLFAEHAKLGGEYRERAPADSDGEIGQVAEWIGHIARQAGIEVPVRQTL